MTEKKSGQYTKRISNLLDKGQKRIDELNDILEDSHKLAKKYGREGLEFIISRMEERHINRLIQQWEKVSQLLKEIREKYA